jgi:glycosyltransferase involved in cell wall biosynthesis
MLSVLIPIFDCPVSNLVKELHRQLEAAHIPFEILVSDNATEGLWLNENQSTLAKLTNACYFLEHEKVGRSDNRNFLASIAKYPWLLFLDGDTAIQSGLFIQNYLNALTLGNVICGGTAYQSHVPDEPKKLLRWLYGRKKEEVPVCIRKKRPWRSYSSFNFVIKKVLFEQIRFDPSLKQYGHEDTLFGRELKRQSIQVVHIDNPLLHLGLDEAPVFIEKTKMGVQNLWSLIQAGKIDQEVSLYKWYKRIEKWGIRNQIAIWFRMREASLLENLTGPKPRLTSFDFFKLGYLATLAEKK